MLYDMNSANALGDLIGDGPPTCSALRQRHQRGFSSPRRCRARSTASMQPLAAVQARVQILVSTVGNTVANVTTLGGILPNNPIAQRAAS